MENAFKMCLILCRVIFMNLICAISILDMKLYISLC